MSDLERANKAEILAMELTEEEFKKAIEEAKIKKWFNLKNAPYWAKTKNDLPDRVTGLLPGPQA